MCVKPSPSADIYRSQLKESQTRPTLQATLQPAASGWSVKTFLQGGFDLTLL